MDYHEFHRELTYLFSELGQLENIKDNYSHVSWGDKSENTIAHTANNVFLNNQAFKSISLTMKVYKDVHKGLVNEFHDKTKEHLGSQVIDVDNFLLIMYSGVLPFNGVA